MGVVVKGGKKGKPKGAKKKGKVHRGGTLEKGKKLLMATGINAKCGQNKK